MNDAPTREIEIAREAASRAAFRMVYAFCAFGFVDFLGAILRTVAIGVLPPPTTGAWGVLDALGSAWGAAWIAVLLVTGSLKLAMIVSLHRRRLIVTEPLSLWVFLGALGIGGRVGASVVAYAQSLWLARAFETMTLAAWSGMSSASSVVGLLLDVAMGVAMLTTAALAVQKDRRAPDPAEGYRSPGRS